MCVQAHVTHTTKGEAGIFQVGGPAFTSSEGGYLSSMYMYIAFTHIWTYIFMMKRLGNIFRERRKNGSHPGIEPLLAANVVWNTQRNRRAVTLSVISLATEYGVRREAGTGYVLDMYRHMEMHDIVQLCMDYVEGCKDGSAQNHRN